MKIREIIRVAFFKIGNPDRIYLYIQGKGVEFQALEKNFTLKGENIVPVLGILIFGGVKQHYIAVPDACVQH